MQTDKNYAFLDTEFSGAEQKFPRLISLAIVPEIGDDFLYLETPSESWQDKATCWVEENVVPYLLGGSAVIPIQNIKDCVLDWLKRQGGIHIVSDYPKSDFAFLKSILHPWPEYLPRDPVEFGVRSLGEENISILQIARSSIFSPELPEHNALADAIALRRMWFAAKAISPSFAP